MGRMYRIGFVAAVALAVWFLLARSSGEVARLEGPRVTGKEGKVPAPALRAAADRENLASADPRPTVSVTPLPRIRELVVRLLETGEPVVSLPFLVRHGGTKARRQVLASGGRLTLSADEAIVGVGDPGWGMANPSAAELEDGGVLWVYKLSAATGRVVTWPASTPLDFTQVRLTARWAPQGTLPVDDTHAPPRSEGWARRHGLFDIVIGGCPEPDGTFSVRVPQLSDMVLRAAAPGWRPGSAEVPYGTSSQGLEIQLRRSVNVRGQVLDMDGEPIRGARVEIYYTLDFPPGFDRSRAHLLMGGAEGMVVYGSTVVTTVSLSKTVGTDADGRFGGHVGPGRLHLMVHAPGYKSQMISVDESSAPEVESTVSLAASDSSEWILMTRRGTALVGWTCLLADVSESKKEQFNPQPCAELTLNDDGRLDGRFMRGGRRYMLRLRPPAGVGPSVRSLPLRFFSYDGRRHIEYEDLAETKIY